MPLSAARKNIRDVLSISSGRYVERNGENPDGNLSKGMRQLNGVYTQTYNSNSNDRSHIQARFDATFG
jgi:hypothetical protein